MKAIYYLWISPYDHPERPQDQQMKGPDKTFVRRHGGTWYRVRIKTHAHAVRRMIATYGFDHFAATHCDPLPSEPPQ